MDDAKVQYVIELLKQGSGATDATQDLKKLQEQSEKTSASFEKLKGGAEKLLSVFGAEIVLREAIDKFIEAEKVNAKLEASLRATGQTGEDTRKVIEDLVSELKEFTGFGGTEITNVIAKLIAMGATKDNIKALTESVLDLSTLMDKDLGRATQAMGRALKGEFGAFTELGFKLDDTANTGQKLASVIEQIGKAAGGQAKAAAGTLGGEMQNLKKNIDELKESIGKLLAQGVGGIGGAFGALGELTTMFDQMGATKTSGKVNDRLRESLEKVIDDLERIGELAPKAAAELRGVLAMGFAGVTELLPGGDPTQPVHQRDLNAEQAALRRVLGRVRPSALSGSSTAAPVEAPAFDVRNAEEERAALTDLNKLKDQMLGSSLSQLDQEKLAAAAMYNERAELIIKVANLARLQEQEKRQLEVANNVALQADLDRLDAEAQRRHDRASLQEQANIEAQGQAERQMRDAIVEQQLRGEDLVKFRLAANHEKRFDQIRQIGFENEDQYAELMLLENQLFAAEQERYRKEHSFADGLKLDLIEIGRQGQQAFAQGLSQAMVDAFSEGDKAFQKFAANFMKQIAQMIFQVLILRSIQSIFMEDGGQIGPTKGQVKAGAAKLAASGLEGVGEVNRATFFPGFNVIAGEAGREVMTVLARPQLMNFGGIAAQVGMAGPNRLAIVNAGALQKAQRRAMGGSDMSLPGDGLAGGEGGRSVVEISLAPGLEANVVKKAVKGSVVEVTRQLTVSGPLATNARRLSQ